MESSGDTANRVPLVSWQKSLMKKSNEQPVNLLELKPKRNLGWETREKELVTLIIPKFKSELLKKWFVPMLAKPNIKVKLDRYGSFVWNRSDGQTSIEKIGEAMAAQFGEPVESLYERIGKFVSKLARDKFLVLS